MKTVMGIINLQTEENLAEELTKRRPLAAVPFAGRYRLVDFTLSSMVNSGIEHVAVVLPSKSRSIMDHLRSGKDWDLARKNDGLSYLPPADLDNPNRKGDLASYYSNLDYVERSRQKYVLIANGNIIYNMDFGQMMMFHANTGADITMLYCCSRNQYDNGGTVLETAQNGLVTDIAVKSNVGIGESAFMGMYLMDKRVFMDVVRCSYERGGNDFLMDAIMRLNGRYSVYAYEYAGYAARIDSIAGYYRASMDMLNSEIWESVFIKNGRIYTKVKDEAPVKYKHDAKVVNSLIANGCVIEGTVENSILFRGVRVAKGAVVKNSIVMQKAVLAEDTLLENVVCDKDVVVTNGKWIKGVPTYPIVIEKGVLI